MISWFEVHVDLIGPQNIKVNNEEMQFLALTCLEPVFNLFEIASVKFKDFDEVTHVFKNS